VAIGDAMWAVYAIVGLTVTIRKKLCVLPFDLVSVMLAKTYTTAK
jgi:hypothetical protein